MLVRSSDFQLDLSLFFKNHASLLSYLEKNIFKESKEARWAPWQSES